MLEFCAMRKMIMLTEKMGKRQKKGHSQNKYKLEKKEIKNMTSMNKDMQINATLRYHFWNIRLAKTLKYGNTQTGKDNRGENTLLTCRWAPKLKQPFSRAIWTMNQKTLAQKSSF